MKLRSRYDTHCIDVFSVVDTFQWRIHVSIEVQSRKFAIRYISTLTLHAG